MKIVKRIVLVSLIGLCLVSFAFMNIPSSSPHATGVSPLYASMLQKIPTLGGGLGAEWTDAWTGSITMQKIGTTTTQSVDVWVKMDNRFIWIGLEIPDTTPDSGWPPHWHDIIFFFDAYHDGALSLYWNRANHDDSKWFTTGLVVIPNPYDKFWDGSTWDGDIWQPFGTNDGECGFYHDGLYMRIEAMLPMSLDRYDAPLSAWNSIVGLYIEYWDGSDRWIWPPSSTERSTDPSAWGDLWTTIVFGASIPHAHDVPGQWVAYLGLMNTGTSASTIVFSFYDDLGNLLGVTTITLNPNAHYGNYVRLILSAPGFVGSIYITSNQPFSGQLNQHDAAGTQMGVYPFQSYW